MGCRVKAILSFLFHDLRQVLRDTFVNGLAASVMCPRWLRYVVYRLYGMQVRTTTVQPGCYFRSNRVRLDSGVQIQNGCMFENQQADVVVGRNSGIGVGTTLCTTSHELGDRSRRFGKTTGGAIVIGEGVWVGANVTILPGVTIGDGSVIAAGAVVTKNCEPDGLYAGVPAKLIRKLNESKGG